MDMSAAGVVAVVFEGGQNHSSIEREMARVRKELTLDSCEKFLAVQGMNDVILCTTYADLAARAREMGVTVEYEAVGDDFHFGSRLRDIVEKYRLERVIYAGGVAAPLITAEELAGVAELLVSEERVVVMNNVQSADLIGFAPAQILGEIPLPAHDNALGWALRDAGCKRHLIPNSARVNFDIDTPTDILILSLAPDLGRRGREALTSLPWDPSRLLRALDLLAQDSVEMLVAGRVGPSVITHINMNFSHRVRVISEERGMKALGRDERGEVVSFLGHLLELAGPERLIALIESTCQVAFIDTRVMFHHLKRKLSDHDRFHSDLGQWEVISDDMLRQFTRACQDSSLPIILGGHSLVSGGLWLLADRVIRQREPGR